MSTCSRYCLDDVRKASGGDLASRPGEWLRYDQAVKLIADLNVGNHAFGSLRTIKRLADRSGIQLPPMGEVKNANGQTVQQYVFQGEQGKRDSITAVAQLSPEFTTARKMLAALNEPTELSFEGSYREASGRNVTCFNFPRREVDIRLTRERISAKDPLSG